MGAKPLNLPLLRWINECYQYVGNFTYITDDRVPYFFFQQERDYDDMSTSVP